MFKTRSLHKILLLQLLIVGFSSVLFLVTAPGTASANSNNVYYRNDSDSAALNNKCYDTGTLMNVVVYTALIDENDKFMAFGSRSTIYVKSEDVKAGSDAGIVKNFNASPGNQKGENWDKEHTFNWAPDGGAEAINYEYCPPNGITNKISSNIISDNAGAMRDESSGQALVFKGLGYGQEGEWKLVCGGSNGRKFTFIGQGTPQNIPSGYVAAGWGGTNGSAVISQDNDFNRGSFTIVLVYRIKKAPPPPKGTLSLKMEVQAPSIGIAKTANNITVPAGTPVTFMPTVTGSGFSNVPSGSVFSAWTNGPPGTSTYPPPTGGDANGKIPYNNRGMYNGAIISANEPSVNMYLPGTYCRKLEVTAVPQPQWVVISPAAGDSICVTVTAITCAGNANASTYIEPGGSASLTLSFPHATTLWYTLPAGFGPASGIEQRVDFSLRNTYAVSLPTAPDAGEYTVTWRTNSTNTNCSGAIKVVQLPYFEAQGSGVRAGGQFSSLSSACTGGGTLAGWFNNDGARYGSHSQLSAIALVKIVGFASSQPVSGTPTALSFTNLNQNSQITTSKNSPSLGGNYNSPTGDGSYCLTEPKNSDSTQPAGSSFNVSGKDGQYRATGNVTITGGDIANGDRVGLYVNGDVYISDNINYNTLGWTRNNIPSFTLVATGNIYISSSVTSLSGTYVAKNTSAAGTKGRIFTCATGLGAPVSLGNLHGACKRQLVIYGSFIASKVNLMRSYGTLRDDRPGNTTCTNTDPLSIGLSSTCAAEVFLFGPEMYLTTPATRPENNGANTFDSITSLPPVL